ncbi:hypothetical protein ADUPG1_004434, partial [Aduncisulcus paluster]
MPPKRKGNKGITKGTAKENGPKKGKTPEDVITTGEEGIESEKFDESDKSTSDGKDGEEKEEVTITTTKSANNHAAHGGSSEFIIQKGEPTISSQTGVKQLREMKTMTPSEIQSDETLKLTVIDPGSASKPSNGIFIEKLKSVGSEQFRA